MATVVIMPRQGQSVESCVIARWHKNKGDAVSVGDALFTYETDKAVFDEEAKVDGTLLDVFFGEGDDVPCLTNVCVIGSAGENTAEFIPKTGEKAEEVKESVVAAPAAADEKIGENIKSAIAVSPRAENLAKKKNIDPADVAPTGPQGRIIERDIINAKTTTVEKTIVTAPAAAAAEEVKHSNIRRVIAKTMHQSLSQMAQLTLNTSFNAAAILNYRKKLKAQAESLGLANITINDIISYAVARTLRCHKDLNAHYYEDKMVYFNTVNLGVAMDTPRGLMVPTLFGADSMSLNEIAVKTKELARAAQEGTISPDLLKDGTFTVTNLGALGVETFTPVINPPQTGILGVNAIVNKPYEENGEIKLYPSMSLSITFDHRALDGAPAARFVRELCGNLENFEVLLAK